MQTDVLSLPGLEAARRLSRLSPPGQRERAAIERLRVWDGRLDPDTIAGTIYQAFLLRLAREVARAAIGDRDLCERWLDRADNGFTPHVTSPWRWHSHLMDLWAEADEELVGRPWDDLVTEALAGALDDLTDRFGPDPGGWRWGVVHEMEFPHPLGEANPLLPPAAEPAVAGGRRPGDGLPDRLRPERSLPRRLGTELADGRRPDRSGPLALADVHRRVGPPRQSALRRSAGALAGRGDAADVRRGTVAGTDADAGLSDAASPRAHFRRATATTSTAYRRTFQASKT